MGKGRARALAIASALALTISGSAVASEPTSDGGLPIAPVDSPDAVHGHNHDQHGGTAGHLPPTRSNVELVGTFDVNPDFADRIADVGVLKNVAYLGAFSRDDCKKGGVYVVDISNPSAPKQLAFIHTAPDSFVGEGIQALPLSTASFSGDLLVFNNEECVNPALNTNPNAKGGVTLVDVTNPTKPRVLAAHAGDFDVTSASGTTTLQPAANEIHSAFAWEDTRGTATNADDKAYVVLVDDEEAKDVDILDITNPRAPVKIAEFDLNARFPQIIQSDLGSGSSFLHDMIVKKIRGSFVMLLSYWDGGYVTLNVDDPRNPKYIADSDFANPDPLLLERTGASFPPEGNAHQAEFSKNNDFIVAADEDFDPYKLFVKIGSAAPIPLDAGFGTGTPALQPGQTFSGGTRFLGRACSAVPAAPASTTVAVVERGSCFFQDKLNNVAAAGYDALIIFNSADGVPPCEGLITPIASGSIQTYFVARSLGYAILGIAGYDPANCPTGTNPALPAVGTSGQPISLSSAFDGWGYVHLYRNGSGKLRELDTYAIPEAHEPAHASGSGDLSVHEVAMSANRNDLAYFAYYAGGFRVAKIASNQLVEVGRFIDQGGSNFWGVELWQRGGVEYVLASDRDEGLYIFRYTGT